MEIYNNPDHDDNMVIMRALNVSLEAATKCQII